MPAGSPQERGRQWEEEVARLVGGSLQPGSGNRVQASLDVSGGLLLVECKHTDADSYRISSSTWESVREAASGSSAATHRQAVLALRLGASGHRLGVVDLDQLVGWLREPPGLLRSTSDDALRRVARTPTLLR